MAAPRKPQANGNGNGAHANGGPRPRILRIGILLGGKIVEERLIRERVPVTIGQSMRNTFSIPVDGLPFEFTLFAIDENKYSLRFLQKMDGRLSDVGGQVLTLDTLKQKSQNHGDYWTVPLSDSARGKLTIGDLTVLFQFVAAPPRQPKPMLPASVRGTLADRIDPQLAVILAASILLHAAIVIFAWYWDADVPERGMAERAYNVAFENQTYTVDLTPPQPTQDAGSAGSAAPEKKVEKPTPKATPKPAEKPGADAGRDAHEQVAMNEEATKFADLLTGEGKDGTSEGDMSRRQPGAELNAQINNVRDSGVQPKVGGGSGRGSRGNGDPRVGTSHGTGIAGPGGVESAGGGKGDEKPQGRIAISDKQSFDESTLTPDLVLAKIQQAYMSGLKRCYKQYLNKDASARGKVTLSLTVNESGRTTKGNAKGFAGEVDECITALMGNWRFPIPKDKDGSATDASFAITLQLVPD
ncbi:MAG TPA: AgmX/PglI C-terminal domain-containing protein [Kofleriaceae bacterium]|jgi:hypothetical protein